MRYVPEYAHDAYVWVEGVALLALDDAILDHAAALEPQVLRSLDALHIATVLISVREEFGVLLTYDDRMAAAAENRGITVASPSYAGPKEQAVAERSEGTCTIVASTLAYPLNRSASLLSCLLGQRSSSRRGSGRCFWSPGSRGLRS